MKILLPPSETKRTGGSAKPVRLAELAHPALLPIQTRATTDAARHDSTKREVADSLARHRPASREGGG